MSGYKPDNGVVIVGAGHSGGRVALGLRKAGYTGRVLLLGAEPESPYERPPLSKAVLQGLREIDSCQLQAEASWEQLNIGLHTGATVDSVDTDACSVRCADGAVYDWSHLVLATGGVARTLSLPGAALGGIHCLRNAADARALRARLVDKPRVVIVGAGFIGLEVAASAVALGCEVTVLEGAPQILGRVLPSAVAEAVAVRHRAAGVDIRTGVQISAFEGDGRVESVRTTAGAVTADLVVVGIGIVPVSGLAEAAGIDCDNGILTDAGCRTSAANVYAAGDVANSWRPQVEARRRMESWQNAEQQAQVVVDNICGGDASTAGVPWVWSDQFDWQIQMAGSFAPDNAWVERPLGEGSSLWFSRRDGQLVGAVGVGPMRQIAKEVRVAQMLIERGAQLADRSLANPAIKLKALLKASE